MATAGQRIVDRPGYGEYIAALLIGLAGGDQRAGLQSRFHDQGAEGKPRDDAVAPREMIGARGCPGRKFADQCAFGGNAGGEFAVLARVDQIRSSAEHRNRAPARIQRGRVGSAVDAVGHAAGDGEAGLRQCSAEASCRCQTVAAGAAAADHGNLRHPQQAGFAIDKQGRRCRGCVAQHGRIGRVIQADEVMPGLREPGQVRLNERPIRCVKPAAAVLVQFGSRRVCAQETEHAPGVTKTGEQAAQAGRSQRWRTQQCQPGFHGHCRISRIRR
jgi:hypothetical protein